MLASPTSEAPTAVGDLSEGTVQRVKVKKELVEVEQELKKLKKDIDSNQASSSET